MRRRPGTPPADLRLDGEGLDLKGLWVDTVKLDGASSGAAPDDFFVNEEGSLFIKARVLPEEADRIFTVKTEVAIHPRTNLKLSGLYVTNDLLCTQCEAEGFRRITFFLDRPDVMALFKVTAEPCLGHRPCACANPKSKAPVYLLSTLDSSQTG